MEHEIGDPSNFFCSDFYPGCTLGNPDAPSRPDDVEKMTLVQQSIHQRYQPRVAQTDVSRSHYRNGPDSSGEWMGSAQPFRSTALDGIGCSNLCSGFDDLPAACDVSRRSAIMAIAYGASCRLGLRSDNGLKISSCRNRFFHDPKINHNRRSWPISGLCFNIRNTFKQPIKR